MFITNQILLDPSSNVVFSYIDSRAPSSSNYETILLVHGNSFSNAIFKRLLPLASEFNIRIVALSRRGFPGSTPLSPTEREKFLTDDEHTQSSASEEFKTEFLNLRGVEILQFIDGFIKHSCIPSIQKIPHSDSEHGQAATTGGLSLTGWSLGCTFTLAAISNVDSPLISEEMRGRLGRYLRAHIMLEPALTALGLPFPPAAWLPFRDPNIPPAAQAPLFRLLVTGYFDYPEEVFSTHDYDSALGMLVPTVSRIPSIFSFSSTEQDEIFASTPDSIVDLYFSKVLQHPLRSSYLKACYDRKLRASDALKNMVVWEVAGDKSYAFTWPTYWEIEKDDMEAGGGEAGRFVRFKVMKGVNHFMHWDEPAQTMKVFRDILDASQVSENTSNQ